VTLDGGASADPDSGDAVVDYAWDLDGDGACDDAAGAQVSLSWEQIRALVCGGACAAGASYPVKLQVSDAFGAASVATTAITPAALLNGSFETGGRIPSRWTAAAVSLSDTRTKAERRAGSYSFRMLGAPAKNKTLSQQIALDGKAGDSFTFSGWSKAVLPDRQGGPYQISVRLTHGDGSTAVHRLNFTRTTHPWERKSTTFTAAKDFTRLTVSATYSRQRGTAWFDDIRVVRN
jgi:hypothetical protein